MENTCDIGGRDDYTVRLFARIRLDMKKFILLPKPVPFFFYLPGVIVKMR